MGDRWTRSTRRSGGSVLRWATSRAVPTVAKTAAVARPAHGCQAADSRATRVGPTMKTISSLTASSAKAVSSTRRSAAT